LLFILKKIAYQLLILFGVVSIVFLLFNALSSDPSKLLVGQRTNAASLEQAKKALHLDEPVWKRYVLYLNDLSPVALISTSDARAGNYEYYPIYTAKNHIWALKLPYLGRSYITKKKVSDMLGNALFGTAVLAFTAILFACIVGIALGVWAALRVQTWIDKSIVMFSVFGISMPSFFVALLIAYLFGYVWHALTGLEMMGSLLIYDPVTGTPQVQLKNLILPALALGIRPLAVITQLTRNAMLEVLSQDYIRTAYAKGLSTYKVVLRHALRNALNPVLTAVSGWLAELLAGSFFIEYIFAWKGIGKITVDALNNFDFPVVMGAVLFTAFIFIVISMLTELLYAQLDPRIKHN
jgi:peptide/nickel transport system permease protein